MTEAAAVVVLWSASSSNSRWVRDEAGDAANRGVLVPVMIDETEPPLGFRSIQAEDLRGWSGEEQHEGFTDLVRAVTALRAGTRSVLAQTLVDTSAADRAVADQSAAEGARTGRRFRWWHVLAGAALLLLVAWIAVQLSRPSARPGSGLQAPVEIPVEPPPRETPPPPTDIAWTRNAALPQTYEAERRFYPKIFGEVSGTISDGQPGRITGVFRLQSRSSVQGIKAFVVIQLLDEFGNVLHEVKQRTWVDGQLSLNRKVHSVQIDEKIPERIRGQIRTHRVQLVEEQ